MTDATDEVFGPIDFVLIEFDGDMLTGEAGGALLDLVEAGTIRLLDAIVIAKAADGSVSGLEISDMDAEHIGSFSVFAGARSGLIGDDDVDEAGSALEPGTVAALLVYENTWAVPFVRAALASGGRLVASARIPAETVMEALDSLDGEG